MFNSSAPSHLIEPLSEVKDAFSYHRKTYLDERGFFCEMLRANVEGMPKFVQQNTSFSYGGVLRGMHTQTENPQGKLITCLYGQILDVVFDVRKNSPTFGKGVAKILDFEAVNSIYAPPGCLHGFVALSRFAVVHYSCTTYYDEKHSAGVRWDSPEILPYFPEDIYPTLSQKDARLPLLADFLSEK